MMRNTSYLTVLLHSAAVHVSLSVDRQPPEGCHQIGHVPQVEHGRNARMVPTYLPCLWSKNIEA